MTVTLEMKVAALREALEGMVEQYLYTDRFGEYDHMYMSAGEEACEVLTELFPDRWVAKPWGMVRKEVAG